MTDLKLWEELRREARQVEADIENKLIQLSKYGSNDSHDDDYSSDKSPLLSNEMSSDRITNDIQSLLDRLTEINNKMSLQADQLRSTPSGAYKLQRHREILNDYLKEFRKTKSILSNNIERKLLLKPNSSNGMKETVVNIPTRNLDALTREQESIQKSEMIVDDSINIALRTREKLHRDRGTFKAIHSQMTTLANRFPVINSLIHRINLKKKKDTIVLSAVIAICLFLLLIYIF